MLERLWDRLSRQPERIPITDPQEQELERRLADLDQDIQSGRGAHAGDAEQRDAGGRRRTAWSRAGHAETRLPPFRADVARRERRGARPGSSDHDLLRLQRRERAVGRRLRWARGRRLALPVAGGGRGSRALELAGLPQHGSDHGIRRRARARTRSGRDWPLVTTSTRPKSPPTSPTCTPTGSMRA